MDRFDFEGRHGVQGRADSRLFSDLTAWFSPAPKILVSIMPPLCPLTNEIVSAPGLLAASAWSKLKFIEEPFCARCGAPFSYEVGAGAECARCIAEPPDFDSARAAIVYDDASHGLIVSFKHADRTDLTPLLAQWLMQAGAGVLGGGVILAPAPLHRTRLFARRYNQAAMLAIEVARRSNARAEPTLLTRIRATPPQKNLSPEARRRNVAGAVAVRPSMADLVPGARIVLVDDVLTTGATLSACARALKRAGARRVDALVLARVVKGGSALA